MSWGAKLGGGRIWRYELEPVDGGTLVRETWDISQEAGLSKPLVGPGARRHGEEHGEDARPHRGARHRLTDQRRRLTPMPIVTVIADDTTTVDAVVADERVLLDPERLPEALGWTLKPDGLCRDDVCVPVRDRAALFHAGRLDLTAVADALDRPTVVDADAGIVAVALGTRAATRRPARCCRARLRARRSRRHAPPPVGVARSASACSTRSPPGEAAATTCPGGRPCRTSWLTPNFTVIAVALDESVDDVRPWTDGITLPVLIDPQHVLTELYAISNVPTVIWIDEDDRIVRPNSVAFSTDMFAEFTGAYAGPHLDALRSWVRDGTVVDLRRRRPCRGPRPVRRRGPRPAALPGRHRSPATGRRRRPRVVTSCGPASSRRWTSPSGAPPCRSWAAIPFGQDFMELYQEWNDAGSPFHGLPPMTD